MYSFVIEKAPPGDSPRWSFVYGGNRLPLVDARYERSYQSLPPGHRIRLRQGSTVLSVKTRPEKPPTAGVSGAPPGSTGTTGQGPGGTDVDDSGPSMDGNWIYPDDDY